MKLFRPPGYTGKGDRYLSKIHKDITALLKQLQKTHHLMTLDLPEPAFPQIAAVIVEFAEDIHNDIGIWRSYETYNRQFFDTPLPLMLKPGENVDEREMFFRRLKHFLWLTLPEFDPGLILSPTYEELSVIAEPVADHLIQAFTKVPTDSGIAHFLQEPVEFGWEVKRKLVWLGQASYLFRFFLGNYIEEQGGEMDIPTIDDFICQQDTAWSGLGVIDILAGLLNVTDDQRNDIRSWYERHMAIFKVQSISKAKSTITVLNVINDQPYKVKMGEQEIRGFRRNRYVQGALVPWDGYWYWSGVQQDYGNLSDDMLEELKLHYHIRMPNVAYRYCDDLLQKAREVIQRQYEEFLKFHGSDLILYADGDAMEKDAQKQLRAHNEAVNPDGASKKDPKSKKEVVTPTPLVDYHDMQNGVAVYFNSEEGQEIMDEFNLLISGLEKQGMDLTDDEEDIIRDFIQSDVISPGFVQRVAQKYGSHSISAAFFISYPDDEFVLDYLLRRYKGFFYRKRYPSVSIFPEGEISEETLLRLFSSQ
jgi:hypothetical protein